MGHVIQEHLNENWNFLVYSTKCIHSWIIYLYQVQNKMINCYVYHYDQVMFVVNTK